MRNFLLGALSALVAATLTVGIALWATQSWPFESDPLWATGTVSVPGYSSGTNCLSWKGYEDIRRSAQVVVLDNEGRTAGIGRLGRGTDPVGREIDPDRRCEFSFTVRVDAGSDFYELQVGRKSRDSVRLKPAQLADVHLVL